MNNLKQIIRKTEGKIDLEIEADFKNQCIREMGVSRVTVNRWIANTSQPNFHRLQQILLILKKYDASITGADLLQVPKPTSTLKNPLS